MPETIFCGINEHFNIFEEDKPTEFIYKFIPKLLATEYFPELILCHGQRQPLEYKGETTVILLDYNNQVLFQQCAFWDMIQALHEEGVKHSLCYTTKLCIRYPNRASTIFTFNCTG